MPNFLRLTELETKESFESRGLITVDEKLCEALGVPVDEKTFFMGWVDWDSLYVTNDWERVKEFHKDWPESLKVINWLAENYSLDGYAMIGRRS